HMARQALVVHPAHDQLGGAELALALELKDLPVAIGIGDVEGLRKRSPKRLVRVGGQGRSFGPRGGSVRMHDSRGGGRSRSQGRNAGLLRFSAAPGNRSTRYNQN